MRVEYTANNSGGSWWLKDADWKALEAAGWWIEWGGSYYCGKPVSFLVRPEDKPACGRGQGCTGHRRVETADEAEACRWLGALAQRAEKDFPSMREAIEEWERVTGQTASDEGCNCCGAPHMFSSGREYVSGDEVLPILYGDGPKSLREAYRALKGRA